MKVLILTLINIHLTDSVILIVFAYILYEVHLVNILLFFFTLIQLYILI